MTSVISASAKALGFGQLKAEQAAAISQFVSAKDVFVALSTSYGKSLCYCCLPYVYDRLRSVEKQSIFAVVSPFVEDQVADVIDDVLKLRNHACYLTQLAYGNVPGLFSTYKIGLDAPAYECGIQVLIIQYFIPSYTFPSMMVLMCI